MAWGMTRHEWGDWHTWISYAFLVLMMVHLILHWRWFWQVAAKKRSWPLILGFGSGVALVLVLTLQPIQRLEKERGQGRDAAAQDGRGRSNFRGR